VRQGSLYARRKIGNADDRVALHSATQIIATMRKQTVEGVTPTVLAMGESVNERRNR
jgi:hypothetical protein